MSHFCHFNKLLHRSLKVSYLKCSPFEFPIENSKSKSFISHFTKLWGLMLAVYLSNVSEVTNSSYLTLISLTLTFNVSKKLIISVE